MKRSLVCMMMLGLGAQAFAGQVEKKDNWVLNEHSVDGATICEASTEDKGVVRHYTLKIQKVKNSHLPVEIFLYEKGKPEYGPIAISAINNEVILMNQSAIEAKSQTFWHLPDETKLIVDYFKTADKTLVVKAYGDSKGRDLKFTTKGAAHILAAMEKRCNAGKTLVDERLSKLSNHPAAFDQSPKVFDAGSLSQIRAIYYELAERHNDLLVQEAQLAKLTEANKPNINERESLKTERLDLLNQKIPGLKQDIQSTTDRIAQGERRLVQLRTEIPAADKVRATAQTRYDEAYKKIEPHYPKHKQLVSDLQSARYSLSEAQEGLSSSESELSNNNTRIQQLDREAQSLSYDIQRMRNELPSLQSEADRRYRDLNNFNANSEIRRRLNGHSQYLSLRSEAERLKRDLDRERDALRSLERDLQRAKAQLGHCQSVPDQNCDSHKSTVSTIEGQVSSKERDVQRLDNQVDSANREIDRIERDVEREVRDIEDRLRRAYDEAASRLSALQGQLDRAEGERRDIMEYQIPRLKNRNIELRDLIAQYESNIVTYTQSVRRAEAELAKFDQSVGFTKLQQTLDAAETQLETAQNNLSALTSEESRLNTQVPADKARLVRLNDALKASEQRLVQVNNRIAQLDKDLAGYDGTKAAIEQKMVSIKTQTQETQSRYMRFFQ